MARVDNIAGSKKNVPKICFRVRESQVFTSLLTANSVPEHLYFSHVKSNTNYLQTE